MPSYFAIAASLLAGGLLACGDGRAPPAGDATGGDAAGLATFSVVGTVEDLSGEAIVDMFVTVSTEYCIPDRTDSAGAFEVQKVSPGSKRLVTYGETSEGGLIASVAVAFESDGDHALSEPLVLPRLTETWPLEEGAAAEQVVTTSHGLILTVPAGALRLAPFAPAELQVARVPAGKAPPFIPDGVVLVDLFALHPILSTLDPPAAVSFPPDTGLPAGTPVIFHALDYETGWLAPAATGVVDAGGRAVTGEGQGLSELTWLGLSVGSSVGDN